MSIRNALERRRARQLGLTSSADQPRVPSRLPLPLGEGRLKMHAAVSDLTTTVVLRDLLTFGDTALRWARRGRRATPPDPHWETWLANELSRDLLCRYDWRRAQPPTKRRWEPVLGAEFGGDPASENQA